MGRLVLSRRVGEAIVIQTSDGIILIENCDIRNDNQGHRTQIGVTAPTSVRIDRKEVYEAIQREGHRKP